MIENWLPTIVTALPAAAGLLLVFARGEQVVKLGALAASLATVALTGWMWIAFKPADGMQFVVTAPWIAEWGIHYRTGVDGISLSMMALTALLTPLCLLASWHSIEDRVKSFFICFLFLEAGMMGVFCAADLFLFYVYWEAMLIPMVLIIGIWGGPRRVYASVKFFLYTMVGSLFMLLAVIACYGYAGMETFDIATLSKVLPAKVPLKEQMWLFAAFALAFAVKVPLFPFHTWLPDAHVEAPTAGSVILAGVLLKMGVYGFIRLAMPFFPDAAQAHSGLIIALSVVSIVFGALMSMSQSDIKKLIAYSSVSHLGFCMLGLFSFTEAGVQGSVLQMVNHGLSTGALFLLVGVLYHRTHKRGIEDFGGLAKVTPVTAATFLIVTLASIGLPGLNGFVSEFLCLAGAFQRSPWAAGISATAVILGAMYMLKLYRDVFWGPVTAPKLSKLEDLKKLEVASLLPLVVLIVVLGLWPKAVLSRTEPGAKALVETMEAHGKR